MSKAKASKATKLKTAARWLAAVAFVGAGVNHFLSPDFYLAAMPRGLPWPTFWNVFTGLAKIAGGIGLLVPRLRRAAAVGLIVMLLGFLWVHVEMVIYPERSPFGDTPLWILWARLPFQFVLIAWVWWVGLPSRRKAHSDQG